MKCSLASIIFKLGTLKCSRLVMYIFLVLSKLGHVGKLFPTGVIITTKDNSGVGSKVAIKCIVLENSEGNQFGTYGCFRKKGSTKVIFSIHLIYFLPYQKLLNKLGSDIRPRSIRQPKYRLPHHHFVFLYRLLQYHFCSLLLTLKT